MSDFLDKLSSYNLFNYLLPGTLLAGISSNYTSYSLVHDNLLIAVFIYYFLGLIISRVGSLVIEPVLRKVGFLKFAEYSDFVIASKQDKTLAQLSEVNNMYRTLCSMILLFVALVLFDALAIRFPFLSTIAPYVVIVALLALFLLSYRKQTDYITRRVDANNPDASR